MSDFPFPTPRLLEAKDASATSRTHSRVILADDRESGNKRRSFPEKNFLRLFSINCRCVREYPENVSFCKFPARCLSLRNSICNVIAPLNLDLPFVSLSV